MENKICVVGLGYVGLRLAVKLGQYFEVVGFDIDEDKISSFNDGSDATGEVSKKELKDSTVSFTTDSKEIENCNFIIICVPTPIDSSNKPNLSHLRSASETVGKHLKKNSIVVYESTVYPGVTEDVCVPILEEASGMNLGKDFKVGYSPERANPGDKEHTVDKIVKVISGSDKKALNEIDNVYSKITKTHRAPSIKVAEGAKVIENIQRDLNIALMNELAILFDKMDLDINEILEAAGTKWNFHKYHPGLVGGHCIPVDPYYLTHKAEETGYNPEVILAGRKINDNMYKFYAEKIISKLYEKGKHPNDSKVLILGVTFKPNVKDYRNSKVKELIDSLKEKGVEVYAGDPNVDDNVIRENFNAKPLEKNKKVDLKVLTVKHREFENVKDALDLQEVYGKN